jgi:ferritin
MMLQWQEEIQHAMKLYTFLQSRGGVVHLQALAEPVAAYQSPLQCFQEVLAHEQAVTQRINDLYEQAQQQKDLPLQIVLQWFISEQVEEESMVNEVLDRLTLIGADGPSIYLLDRQLATRIAAPSTGSSKS